MEKTKETIESRTERAIREFLDKENFYMFGDPRPYDLATVAASGTTPLMEKPMSIAKTKEAIKALPDDSLVIFESQTAESHGTLVRDIMPPSTLKAIVAEYEAAVQLLEEVRNANYLALHAGQPYSIDLDERIRRFLLKDKPEVPFAAGNISWT